MHMRAFFFSLFSFLYLLFISGHAFPVLDPFNPQYHWMDVLIEKDFPDKMLWARWHDEECKKLAMRSRAFMQTHSRPEQWRFIATRLYCGMQNF